MFHTTGRKFNKGSKTMIVLIDPNRTSDMEVWFSVESNDQQIDSGFMSKSQYLTKVKSEDWTQDLTANYNRLV